MMKEAVAVLFLSHMVEQHTMNAQLPAAMGNFGVHSVLHLFNFTPIIGLVVVSNRIHCSFFLTRTVKETVQFL